jgi:hypothetical protein
MDKKKEPPREERPNESDARDSGEGAGENDVEILPSEKIKQPRLPPAAEPGKSTPMVRERD